jgi:DNA mismatch repair protein MutL
VHPGKTEIKFENDKNIYQIMKAAVKRSIGLFNLSPSIDFESDPNEFLFQKSTEIPQAPGSAIDYEYNPFKPTKQHNLNLSPKRDWQQFFENFEQKQHKTERIDRTELATELFEKEKIQPKSTTIFQLNQRFIVAPIAKGLLLVDQKAAHEKILFHQLVQHTHPIEKQLLLYPISFECPNPIVDFLTDLLPLLNDMGIEIKHFGQNTFVIEAHPMLFSEEGIEQLIAEMIQDKSFQQESDILLIRKHIASKLAIHKAIPHGKILSTEEMEDLVSKLFMCTEPEYGIRKNKTMVVLSAEEIITLINK